MRGQAPYSSAFRNVGVDLLDIDATVLHRLSGVGDVQQLARGLLGIGIRACVSVFHLLNLEKFTKPRELTEVS